MFILSFLNNRRKAGFPLLRRAGAALLSPGGSVPGATANAPPVEMPKGLLRSKTIVATLAGFIYTGGVALGLWDMPQEQFLAIAIPAVTTIIAVYGRIVAKTPLKG